MTYYVDLMLNLVVKVIVMDKETGVSCPVTFREYFKTVGCGIMRLLVVKL
jgi:hypothetical protein